MVNPNCLENPALTSYPSRPAGPMKISALCALLFITGCRSYQPDPLEPQAHRDAWQARTPGDESVRAFAERLASDGDDAAASFDPADGLSLGEAELVALIYNPELRLARLEAGVASAAAEYAGRWDDPRVEAELLRVTESVSRPWIVGGGLSISLPISGRLDAEKAQATAEHRTALHHVAEAEWQTRYELRLAWLRWSAASVREEELSRLIASVDGLTQTVARLAQAGEADPTEAALFEIERSQREAALRRTRGDVAALEQQLRALMGLSPSAELTLIPDLSLPESAGAPGIAELGEQNPTLLRLSAAYEASEQTLRREVLKQVPDLTLGLTYENEEGQSRVGLAGGIPIPIINLNRQAIAEAQAKRALARARFETEYEQLVGRFAAAQARITALQEEQTLLLDVTVPLIDQQLDDARRLLQIGEAGTLVLLESLTRAHDTRLHLIEVKQEHSAAFAQLRYLAGPATQFSLAPGDNNDENEHKDDPTSAEPAGELSR